MSQMLEPSFAGTEVGPAEVECPDCGYPIDLKEGTISGEIVECPECALELEVFVNEEGEAAVREAPQEGEDWGE